MHPPFSHFFAKKVLTIPFHCDIVDIDSDERRAKMRRDLFRKMLRNRCGRTDTNAELVRVLGISKNTASARLRNRQPFRSDELEKIRVEYELTDTELVEIFVKEG